MRISDILIEDKIKEKILAKHNLTASEIKHVILAKPYVLRARGNRYGNWPLYWVYNNNF